MKTSGPCSSGPAHSTAPPLTALHPKLFRPGQTGAGREEGARPSGHAALDRELPGGGWPRAGLIELCSDLVGIGELSLVLGTRPLRPLVKAESRGRVWILPPDSNRSRPWVPYAPGLIGRGVALDHLAVIRPARHDEALWCAEQAARSGAVAEVLIWPGDPACSALSLRRLQQAAAVGGTAIFAWRLRAALAQPSPAVLRLALNAEPDGTLAIDLVKRRGLPGGKTVRLAPRELACLQRPRESLPHPVPGPLPWLARLSANAAGAAKAAAGSALAER